MTHQLISEFHDVQFPLEAPTTTQTTLTLAAARIDLMNPFRP
jgi:hypothetical protein